MDIHSNDARMIRTLTEELNDLAERYNECGMVAAHDEVYEVAEAVARLHRLPNPTDPEE